MKNLKESYPKILLILYLVFWVWMAISPKYRSVWVDENILPIIFIAILIITYRKFKFSNTSYSLIFIFMILHAIGGHYSYTDVPLFNFIKENYGLIRNYYDRLVHFLFGVLFFLPVYEILTKVFKVPKGKVALLVTLIIMIGLKESFELIEYGYTIVRNNSLTITNYLGEQGDVFDSIKDVTVGTVGAMISMFFIFVKEWFFDSQDL